MVGGVRSSTVTVKLALAVLPWASVAEQVTVVGAKPNTLPEAGSHDTATTSSTRSLAVGRSKVTGAPAADSASATRSGLTLASVGGVVSTTVTTKVRWAVLPRVSLATQSTGVASSANVLPDAGVQTAVTAPSTASAAAGAVNVTTAPLCEVASLSMSTMSDITGGCVSRTVTLNEAAAWLP